jgi:hypothetical protein
VSHPRPCGDGALWEIWAAEASHAVALPLRDIQLRLSQWGYWFPLFTIWDSVAGPGRTPMPGNNSGRAIEPAVSLGIGRAERDYGGGSE